MLPYTEVSQNSCISTRTGMLDACLINLYACVKAPPPHLWQADVISMPNPPWTLPFILLLFPGKFTISSFYRRRSTLLTLFSMQPAISSGVNHTGVTSHQPHSSNSALLSLNHCSTKGTTDVDFCNVVPPRKDCPARWRLISLLCSF